MKYFWLFFFLIEFSVFAEVQLNFVQNDNPTLAKEARYPYSKIRKLPSIVTPKHIHLQGENVYNDNDNAGGNEIENKLQSEVISSKESNEDVQGATLQDVSVTLQEVSASSDDALKEEFCQIYDKHIHDIVESYRNQINQMNNIASSTDMNPKKYFCRAFSSIMLIEEGTGITNATYIGNAKSDIKKAISANDLASDQFKIDIIEDKFLTAIFSKYNEVITKDMTDDQKALIDYSITHQGLLALKEQIDNNKYNHLDEQAGTTGSLQEKESVDLNPYYTKNQLPLLNSINDINGDTTEQTQTLRSFRVTEEQMESTEVKLDEMLEVIEGLDM